MKYLGEIETRIIVSWKDIWYGVSTNSNVEFLISHCGSVKSRQSIVGSASTRFTANY